MTNNPFYKKDEENKENKEFGHSKEKFLNFPWWGKVGYQESFCGFKSGYEENFASQLSKFYNKHHTCLEIGCGGGFWAKKYLCPNFSRVVGVDLLPSEHISILNENSPPDNFEYIEVGDRDYSCSKINDESIDFVFSFGVFCHMPNSAVSSYLDSIYRKLKFGGQALITFPDFYKKKKYLPDNEWVDEKIGSIDELLLNFDLQNKCRDETDFTSWYYMDNTILHEILLDSRFSYYQDASLKGDRDCAIHFKK
jgi:SAM-dependent methyltransferase